MSKINKESPNPIDENQKWLQEKFPSCFIEGKVDFDKLKELTSEFTDNRNEKYSFSWAGRADSIKNIQTPTHGTLIPQKDESINFDDTENIFIEGENLEVLKLLQKSYTGKVKMIYIDPPYNTGHDFIYKDDFKDSLESYLKQTGQSEDGIKLTTNTETSGRFHSNWISLMYPRLFLARELLREDGSIAISIDDKEFHNLRFILNEIFGEENFVADIIWQKRYTRSNNTVEFTTVVEHILLYSKSAEFSSNLLERTQEADSRYSNPDNDPRGPWKGASFLGPVTPKQRPNLCYTIINPNTKKETVPTTNAWRRSLDEFNRLHNDGRLYWGKNGDNSVPSIKMYLEDARKLTPINFWNYQYAGNTDDGTKNLKELFSEKVFDNPKPVLLIKRIIEHTCEKNDLVLDFFGGSGTTGQAILELNTNDWDLRLLMVQVPEKTNNKNFPKISDVCTERLRRTISKISEQNKQQKLDKKKFNLGFKVFKLTKSNYKIWEDVQDEEKLKDQLKLFEDPLVENYKDINVIYEIIIKEGYSLNSKIETLEEKPNKIYKVSDGEFFFYVTLDEKIDEKALDDLNLDKNIMFVCLDSAINDSQKTNLDKLCKLRTI
jgi:adenine-specific DNA-methyltransferase